MYCEMGYASDRVFNVRVLNETWEELELDDLAVDNDSWIGEWFLPNRIRARSTGLFCATDARPMGAEILCGVIENSECDLTYLIGGDRDRPVYFHMHAALDRADQELVEVWTPPTCRARVGRRGTGANFEVEVSPVQRKALSRLE